MASSDIDDTGRLTTGESVGEYINRKLAENPEMQRLLGEEPPDPEEETYVEEPADAERGGHGTT